MPVLGPKNSAEDVEAAKVSGPHGFHLRKINFEGKGRIPAHSRAEEEVVFVQDGAVALFWGDKFIELQKGDTITVPTGLVRSWWSIGESGATVFVVRGGDAPAAPTWIDDDAITQKQTAFDLAS